MHFSESLRGRIMAFVGILFLALTLLITVSILSFVSTTERDTWRARQTEAAKNAAARVADYLRQNENALYWLDKYEYDEIKSRPEILEEMLQDNPAFLEIIFVDKNGNPQYSVARGPSTLSNQFTILQSEWFQTANAGQKMYTRVQTSPQNESYTILAMPSLHGGVVAAQIRMDALWKTVEQIRFGETGSIYVVNSSGQVIAHPDKQIVLSNQNIRDTEQFTAVLNSPNKEWNGDTINFSGVNVVSVSAPVELTDWIVISELPQEEAYEASRRALFVIPLGIVLLVAIATYLLRAMITRIFLQPLDLLREGANQVSLGNLSHRIAIPRRDELGEAMAGFNAMASDLESQRKELQTYANALEKRVEERTAELQDSLHEKEVLLKEIHHRVKNNLQVISSLLNLQANQVKDTGALRSLRDSHARVRSMALIHEKLYNSKSLARIDFGEYVRSLSTDLFRSYQRELGVIQLKIEVTEIYLDLDQAIPCGLILNELTTNALKYAFPNGRNGTIRVELGADPDQTVRLRVADDGVGLPNTARLESPNSLGWQLIRSLVKQLNADLQVDGSNGTNVEVSFNARWSGDPANVREEARN